MKFDRYTISARLFPAMLSAIPFFVLSHYFVTPRIGDFIQIVSSYSWAGDLTITAAGVFLLIQASRWISKPFFEDRIFKRGSEFPSTNFLLFLNKWYSTDYTHQIHEKISVDFNITLHTEREEAENLSDARRRIKEAVALIRNTVGDKGLVLQHNIEYGFARNFAGGAVVAAVVSVINLMVFYFVQSDNTAFTVSLILLIFYGSYVACASTLIRYLGNNYADVLINQYMRGRD